MVTRRSPGSSWIVLISFQKREGIEGMFINHKERKENKEFLDIIFPYSLRSLRSLRSLWLIKKSLWFKTIFYNEVIYAFKF